MDYESMSVAVSLATRGAVDRQVFLVIPGADFETQGFAV